MTATTVPGPAVDVTTSTHVADLHRDLGIIVRAAVFAVDQLGRHEQDAAQPHVAQSLAVLRYALDEITR